MALVTSKDLIGNYSAATEQMLNSITANKIWAETSLQYYVGDSTALSLDGEFLDDFRSTWSGNPDAVFAFGAVTARAYAMIDTVSQLDFAQTDVVADADAVVVSVDKPNSDIEGFFEFPGTSYDGPKANGDSWSLGAFNSGLDYMLEAGETGGGEYANWTILHEIGHSLGLKHTHRESDGAPLATIGKFMDNERYSVMSYNGASNGTSYGHAVTFMALDVAALQALYGKEDYAVGASTYELSAAKMQALDLTESAVEIGRAYYCIWDSSGEDQIAFDGSGKSVLINLNAATLDTDTVSSGLKAMIAELKTTVFYKHLSDGLQQEIIDPWHHAGGFFSRVLDTVSGGYKSTAGGYTIAHGVTIENAFGGASADLLIGNQAGNKLYGSAGSDTLLGSGGNDFLYGGENKDRIDGGKGDDFLMGGSRADRFIFSDGYGKDRIDDFMHGEDKIDLIRLTDFSSYNDLFNNHMKDTAAGVLIRIGTDQLIIEDLTKADLHNSDFLI